MSNPKSSASSNEDETASKSSTKQHQPGPAPSEGGTLDDLLQRKVVSGSESKPIKPGTSNGSSTFEDRLRLKVNAGHASPTNKPDASTGGSTFEDHLRLKVNAEHAPNKPDASTGGSTFEDRLRLKIIDSGSPSNKPGASKGGSTFDDRLQRKIQGSYGATSSLTDHSGSARGMCKGEGGNRSDAKSTKEQWIEEERVAEGATATAVVTEANRFASNTRTSVVGSPSCVHMNNANASQDESKSSSTAGLLSSCIAPPGRQQAHAPRQSQASFSQAMLQRSAGQQDSQARRHDFANRTSGILSAIIQRKSSVPTDSNQFQGSAAIYDSQLPVTAVLVDDEDIPAGEIVEAQAVGFFEQKWKLIVFVVVVVAGALLAWGLTAGRKQPPLVTPSPTSSPTLKPTFDPRPTIEQIQERGFVRCGTWNGRAPLRGTVCALVASALFGDPSKVTHIPVSKGDRFISLENRETDLLVDSVSYTIQREVKERTTERSFIFSKIYLYARAIYMGNQTYVECAETKQRYGHCSGIRICCAYPSGHYDFLARQFPSDYIVPVSVRENYGKTLPLVDSYVNGTCNTIFADDLLVKFYSRKNHNQRRQIFSGNQTAMIDPQGIVTRGDDREFADVMSWVINAAIYGEEQNISKNPSLCQPYDSPPTASYEIDYMLAVYCVGNYMDVSDEEGRGEMNRINNGTSMVLPTTFDVLADPNAESVQGTLAAIRSKGRLDCGVVVPTDVNVSLMDAKGAIGVSVSYCKALSAAILNGDVKSIRLLPYLEESDSVEALNDGTVDVVAGAKAQMQYDLGGPGVPGVFFTAPYLYGNETASEGVTMVTMATREDDEMFCSFVNLVVLAPSHAQVHGINQLRSDDMPLVSIFGSNIGWALRDAVGQTGSYYEILSSNEMGVHYDAAVMNEQSKVGSLEFTMDRNTVVDAHEATHTPLMLSTPGLKEYKPN